MDTRPIETDTGGAFGQLGGAGEGGQPHRHIIEQAVLFLGLALFGLDHLPGDILFIGGTVTNITENMRMAADQFFAHAGRHVVEIEQAHFFGDARMKNHLEQQVAQFLLQVAQIVALDGIGHLVGFLDGVGRDGIEGLFLVPRAAGFRIAQPSHDFQQAFDAFVPVCSQSHNMSFAFSCVMISA